MHLALKAPQMIEQQLVLVIAASQVAFWLGYLRGRRSLNLKPEDTK